MRTELQLDGRRRKSSFLNSFEHLIPFLAQDFQNIIDLSQDEGQPNVFATNRIFSSLNSLFQFLKIGQSFQPDPCSSDTEPAIQKVIITKSTYKAEPFASNSNFKSSNRKLSITISRSPISSFHAPSPIEPKPSVIREVRSQLVPLQNLGVSFQQSSRITKQLSLMKKNNSLDRGLSKPDYKKKGQLTANSELTEFYRQSNGSKIQKILPGFQLQISTEIVEKAKPPEVVMQATKVLKRQSVAPLKQAPQLLDLNTVKQKYKPTKGVQIKMSDGSVILGEQMRRQLRDKAGFKPLLSLKPLVLGKGAQSTDKALLLQNVRTMIH